MEVSKLSGWLKADAPCRVEGRACDAGGRGASREAGGPGVWWRHTRGMHGRRARLKAWGSRARAERTVNIQIMSMTLEVSKLSGWLKVDAYCRIEGEGMRCGGGEVRAGRRDGLWGWRHDKRHARGPTQGWGPRARAELTSIMAYMSVTLELSKLSGWLKAFAACRVEGEGMRCGGGEVCEPGGGRAWGVVAAHKRHARVDVARLKAWGPRARAERTKNIWVMSVTLEVSKLSGWLKVDASCRVEGRACDTGGERWEPGSGRACVVWWRDDKRHARGKGPTQGLGAKGVRAERTLNMERMDVTLEVSQLEMSALKFFKLWKR